MFTFLNPRNIRVIMIRLLDVLRLHRVIRRILCRLFGPSRGFIKMEIRGASAIFYVLSNTAALGLKASSEIQLIEKIVKILKPGDCVYDIGAGFGLYTLFLARVVGKQGLVVAFEPARHVCGNLLDNLTLNGLINVRVNQVALGDSNTLGELELIGAPSLIHSVKKERINKVIGLFQSVKIVKGDQFVNEMHLRIPKVVKIDVEGYEYDVIRGLSNTLSANDCRIICCEIHPHLLPNDITKQQVIDLLKSLGFFRFEFFKCGLRTIHVISYKN